MRSDRWVKIGALLFMFMCTVYVYYIVHAYVYCDIKHIKNKENQDTFDVLYNFSLNSNYYKLIFVF